jgi:hypothetical protein
MKKWIWMSCLLMFATASVVEAQAPAGSAQWSVDGGPVGTLGFHRLYNSQSQRHLVRKSNGSLDWATEAAGRGTAFFENCTRPGEVAYGSDRVALRYGTEFLIASGPAGRGWTSDRKVGCQYRLIPGGVGFAPAGSGNHNFAIYNISNNRYLVRTDSLIWKEMGGAPGGVVARADFVPDALDYTFKSDGYSNARLFIKNIGNVPSSTSQQEMKFNFNGQKMELVVLKPVEPGASVIKVIRVPGVLPRCVLVELDTNTEIKFQILPGGLPNDFVFLNDRRNMLARRIGSSTTNDQIPCERTVVR